MLPRYVILIIALALFGAACSDSTTTTTASDSTALVEFGSGSVPETMPAGFPVPDQGIVGSTLIDRDRGRTEMIVRVTADLSALTAFFETNLPGRGFTVDSSQQDGDGWKIEFSWDDGTGTIELTSVGQGISQALITFTHG